MPVTSVVPDETIQRLRSLFPDTLIVAALDLVDRDSGELIFTLLSVTISVAFNHLCRMVIYARRHFVFILTAET